MQPTHTEYIRSDGSTHLFVQSWLPDAPPQAVVGIVHGWSDHGKRYGHAVADWLPRNIGVVTVDLRGHGESSGQRGHVEQWADFRTDTHTFVQHLIANYPDRPVFLMGHSMGGLTVMDWSVHHPDQPLKGLLISAPLLAQPNISPMVIRLLRVLARVAPRLSINPNTDPNSVSRDPAIVASYENDPLSHQRTTPRLGVEIERTQQFVLANLDGVRYPLMLVFGGADPLVPPALTRESFEKLGAADKTRLEVPDGYHEPINDLGYPETLAQMADWIIAHTTPA